MTITVNTTDGQMPISNGVDWDVDWPNESGEPGLAILDKSIEDPTGKQVAYFAPGCWKGVTKT